MNTEKYSTDSYALVKVDHEELFKKRIWKIKDVSDFTGLSVATIYNKTSRDEIPYRKRAGRLYFIPLEIENWIHEGN